MSLPWQVGHNGATELTRAEAQRFARSILDSQTYRDKLISRAESGDLPPAIESMLWHYAYGKPVEEVAVSVRKDLDQMSPEQLVQEYEKQLKALKEAEATLNALPAEIVQSVA